MYALIIFIKSNTVFLKMQMLLLFLLTKLFS